MAYSSDKYLNDSCENILLLNVSLLVTEYERDQLSKCLDIKCRFTKMYIKLATR